MPARICLVEDDSTIRNKLAEALTKQGAKVEALESGEQILSLKQPEHDLYVLDVLLPNTSGYKLCEHLRKLSPSLPILFLSALSDSENKIEGLKSGADDYMTKPFDLEEFLLRVERMLKRSKWFQESVVENASFEWGPNRINFKTFEAENSSSKFSLNHKECMILKMLVQKKGEVVTRDEILDQIWGQDAFPTARTVDNFIVKLRKYFEEDPANPVNILSVRSVGYKFYDKLN